MIIIKTFLAITITTANFLTGCNSYDKNSFLDLDNKGRKIFTIILKINFV